MGEQRSKPDQTTIGRQVLPVYDPSANVLLLVEAANKRQDDLRAGTKELAESEVRRINGEMGCIKEVAKLTAKHFRDRFKSEATRVDSVRQIDIATFNTTVGEIRTAVKALADVTTSTAATLQARVDATAVTLAKSGADQIAEVMKRIAALELSAAQGIGKQAVSDPQMDRMSKMVEAMALGTEKRAGKGEGISAVWVVVLGGVSMLGGLLGIAGVLYSVLKP